VPRRDRRRAGLGGVVQAEDGVRRAVLGEVLVRDRRRPPAAAHLKGR
jgi:hypothetical protein